MKKQFLIVLLVTLLFVVTCGSEMIHVKEDVIFIVGKVESAPDGYYKYTADNKGKYYHANTITHEGLPSIYIHRDVIKYDVGDTIRINFVKKKDKYRGSK